MAGQRVIMCLWMDHPPSEKIPLLILAILAISIDYISRLKPLKSGGLILDFFQYDEPAGPTS